MRKKKLYPILAALVLVVFFSMSLLYMGCKEGYRRDRGAEIVAAERLAEKEEERLAKAEEEKQSEEAAPAEEATNADESSFPAEPVTYSGSIGEEGQVPIAVILKVNFKTTEVTGSLSYGGEGINTYVDATITDGKIKLDTLEITSNYSGVTGSKAVEGSEGVEYKINGTITGIITDDLSTFNGEIKSEEGIQKFTASKK